MITVYKYELVHNKQVIEMPNKAKILCVQVQNEKVCLWAIVDTTKELRQRHIVTGITGGDYSALNDLRYIGTYQLGNGSFVGHVFEEIF